MSDTGDDPQEPMLTVGPTPAPPFPDARVVRTDCDPGDSAENRPLPAAVAAKTAEQKSPAQWAYERLVLYIQKFEEGLDDDHEVGLGFAGSPGGMLRILGMGYFAPDVITFYGLDPSGSRAQLIQHVSQLNVTLKAARKLAEQPNRIGFQLKADLEADPEAGPTLSATDE